MREKSIHVRLPLALWTVARQKAEREGISLNAFCSTAIAAACRWREQGESGEAEPATQGQLRAFHAKLSTLARQEIVQTEPEKRETIDKVRRRLKDAAYERASLRLNREITTARDLSSHEISLLMDELDELIRAGEV